MITMYRPLAVVALLVALFHSNVAQQVQMPEAGALHLPDGDLSSQVLALQRNVSELWTYIYQLRSAVSQHLNHLRQHQVELEDMVHTMSHYHDGHGDGTSAAHTDSHHHSSEQHSHSNEQHSHGDDHHSHGDDHHSHGDDHHSHSDEHSHGSDGHSHSSHDHYHDSHSHSHSHDSHGSHSSHEEGDHHHHDHKDSHEKEDDLQQSQQGADLQQIPQGAGPVAEPVVVARSHVTPGSSTFKPLPLMNNYHHHHHHHHDNEPRRNRSRVVVMPKYSEYDLYEFAVCNVQPNRAIPVEQQQEITGQVTLWQKKMGGSLNLHVRLQGFDMGDHHGHHQQAVQQEDDNQTPAPAVHKHGFHVHASGDLSNGCQSTGSHYNPKNANHGGPNALVRHVGDLGNIECDDHGVANIVFSDDVASLKGPYSIVGKAIVIHALPDDLGLGGNEESLKTGNAGTRLACCVIEKVDKLPIRSYKAIKTAKQYQN
ncbi:Extracellular superoxide dismutase [Cu-Zn] like protein [Argiope bruennichi]|uniref:Extracellular superoxide dismutase [Cu-Zn] like protein n=1 Tax=Argiope bruennichi TaxID=94029 RepID=A0A8T0E5L6_ARGBR|nr:Extracellular superoxide dismutase [Cu-Zn] like protein [Argiope bruennichi]